MMFHHSTVPQVWCQKHLPYGSYHEFLAADGADGKSAANYANFANVGGLGVIGG